jgi:hypothetical protein
MSSNARLWFHFLQAKISKEKAEKDASLVKTVMETSGGDNAQLARKIHERYDRCVSLLCAGFPLRTSAQKNIAAAAVACFCCSWLLSLPHLYCQ